MGGWVTILDDAGDYGVWAEEAIDFPWMDEGGPLPDDGADDGAFAYGVAGIAAVAAALAF